MNAAFRNLSSDTRAQAGRIFTDTELMQIFELSEDEIALARATTTIGKCNADPTEEGRPAFEEFLKAEYDNIAKAHFSTGDTIAKFFQFYLLIIAIPVTAAGILAQFRTPNQPVEQLMKMPAFIGLTFAISWIGLCMLIYLLNLRLEALHYARAVNGIRKYFYKRLGMEIQDELAMRALPRSLGQPRYREFRSFGFVVLAFAILDSLYFSVFVWASLSYAGAFGGSPGTRGLYVTTICTLSFFGLHFLAYLWLIHYYASRYLRTHIIGLDIDGVLSNHRSTFSLVLGQQADISLLPESITRIPVNECDTLRSPSGEQLRLTQQDEHRVFNRLAYWRDMQAYERAADVLRELKEAMHFRLVIFTHRPWPNPSRYPSSMPKDATREWQELIWPLSPFIGCKPALLVGGSLKWPKQVWNSFLEYCRRRVMTKVTKTWLEKNGMNYDRLVVERGDVHVADPRTRSHNRFRLAEEKEIRIFVEDDLRKALKLADICEIVYLINQPYNQADNLPNNLIRVPDWDAIRRHIRDHL